MTDQIKPCPFCGAIDAPGVFSHSEIYRDTHGDEADDEGNPESYAVCCDFHNGGCGGAGPYDLEEAEAIRLWNRRAAS